MINHDDLRDQVIHSLREGADLRLQLIEECSGPLIRSAESICDAFRQGGKLLIFGNGGSAADAQHMAAEFVGRFSTDRAPLAAIALTTDTSALTAIANDYSFDDVFARQVNALGRPPDVAIAISTSGRSKNVLKAVNAAVDKKLTTIAFSGNDGGALAPMVDIPIVVPSANTARIQECHVALEHILCELVEYMLVQTEEKILHPLKAKEQNPS